jgi:hypothetical protein
MDSSFFRRQTAINTSIYRVVYGFQLLISSPLLHQITFNLRLQFAVQGKDPAWEDSAQSENRDGAKRVKASPRRRGD